MNPVHGALALIPIPLKALPLTALPLTALPLTALPLTALPWTPLLQLAPKMRPNAMLPDVTGRAEITHFAIAGKVLLGLHLFSRSPGIRGVDFSFVDPPTIDVQVM